MKNFLVGAHMSVAGGIHLAIERAINYGFNCLQIFTHSPRLWNAKKISQKEITLFNEFKSEIRCVVVHAPYLPNLASPDKTILDKSINTVYNDLIVADEINADFYVIHPGSHKKSGVDNGIQTLTNSLINIFRNYPPNLTFLLETMPGAGATIGGSLNELARVINNVHSKLPNVKIGICVDTAHVFAAGIDIRNETAVDDFISDISKTVGRTAVKIVHSNDSFEPLASKKDRHNHIGKGEIGIKGFENMMKKSLFRKLPWILETPKSNENSDIENKTALMNIYNNLINS